MGLHELHPALSYPHPPHDFPVVFALLLGRSMCLSLSPFHPTSNYSPSSHSLIHSLTARSHVSDCMCPTQLSNIFNKCVETRVTTSFKWGWLNGVGGNLRGYVSIFYCTVTEAKSLKQLITFSPSTSVFSARFYSHFDLDYSRLDSRGEEGGALMHCPCNDYTEALCMFTPIQGKRIIRGLVQCGWYGDEMV